MLYVNITYPSVLLYQFSSQGALHNALMNPHMTGSDGFTVIKKKGLNLFLTYCFALEDIYLSNVLPPNNQFQL